MSQQWGVHGCMVPPDPMGYQLLDILQNDNYFAIANLVIFFVLFVFKVSSDVNEFDLFLLLF